tara:strand:- start:397 stop:510 length:114 start_codon:yes stop_codon:yes gene_type:complete
MDGCIKQEQKFKGEKESTWKKQRPREREVFKEKERDR